MVACGTDLFTAVLMEPRASKQQNMRGSLSKEFLLQTKGVKREPYRILMRHAVGLRDPRPQGLLRAVKPLQTKAYLVRSSCVAYFPWWKPDKMDIILHGCMC